MFDWNYIINHNITRSLRFSFSATNNRIIRDFDDVPNNNKNPLWSNIWSIGETNNHSQSLTLNYKLPFRYFPFLDFLDGNYTYTGDFNWQRGSRAFSNVISDDGTRLGNLNTCLLYTSDAADE